jgi:hypothetical protein
MYDPEVVLADAAAISAVVLAALRGTGEWHR